MKIQKVVRIEVTSDDSGNTEINLIFGLEGAVTHNGYGYSWPRLMFTETNRISLSFHEGYALRHFDGWFVPAPRLHPTDDLVKVIEAACCEAAGWDLQEQALPGYVPAQGSFQSQRGF